MGRSRAWLLGHPAGPDAGGRRHTRFFFEMMASTTEEEPYICINCALVCRPYHADNCSTVRASSEHALAVMPEVLTTLLLVAVDVGAGPELADMQP